MDLSSGSRLGPYEILAPLGAGGMGEVYRARDTRLGRDVAIKVLPADLTDTPEARARFEREARAISHLNHPNICTLHDVGREGGTDFLVMELITGGSLRDRPERKALPVEQVLDLGIQIADALEAAHARGIVHRDLKPANVLLTEQGQAKVTGFELPAPGTGAYGSPEQVRGEEVDPRSDVFSLGAVLYEMASGHRAFEGSSTAVIFEAILNRTPAPVSMLRPDTPPELDRIIGKALEKDRELRYQTAGEVRSDLKRLKRDLESSRVAGAAGDSGSRARSATGNFLPAAALARRRLTRIAWTAAVILVVAGVALVATRVVRREPTRAAVRLSLDAPRNVAEMGSPRISPDGRFVAFTAMDSTGQWESDYRIWVQPLDGRPARPLPGTDGTGRPFWSPDSRFIGFCSDNKLKKIDVSGGEPITICEGVLGDGSWGTTGTILLDSDNIQSISASGGQPVRVASPDPSRGESSCEWPQFLPDGRHFLYLARGGPYKYPSDSTALRVGFLGSRESKILAVGEFSRIEYVPPGFILYLRGRTLLAQPFDAKRLRLTGDAFPVVDDVLRADPAGNADFSASGTGALVYREELAVAKYRLVWMDRTGRETGTLGAAGNYWMGVALSPDDQRVAVSAVPPGEQGCDIWTVDVGRDVAMRITSDPGNDLWPVWSPDGATILFSSIRTGKSRVWMKPASGIGQERELPLPPGNAYPQSVTRDGRTLFAFMGLGRGKSDIVRVALDASARTTPLGIGITPSAWTGSVRSLSPDGRWIAYVSAETGRDEVYVVDYPGLTGKWRVSIEGGHLAQWSADGREIYFMTEDRKLMSAAIATSPMLRVARPVRVLENAPEIYDFAPASDGKRFLAIADARGEKLPATKVVLNWQAAVRRR